MGYFIDTNASVYYCDTEEDLKKIKPNLLQMGAEFVVISTGETYIVNSKLELVLLKKNSANAEEVEKLAQKVDDIENKGVSEEKISQTVENYLVENPINISDSPEISYEKDGTLVIKEVNANKIEQSDGDTLILFGGTAEERTW